MRSFDQWRATRTGKYQIGVCSPERTTRLAIVRSSAFQKGQLRMSRFKSERKFGLFAGFHMHRKTATSETTISAGVGLASGKHVSHRGELDTRQHQSRPPLIQADPKPQRQISYHPPKQLSAPMIRIGCGYCHSQGSSYGNVCPVCGGARDILVPTASARCGYCHGSGHYYAEICPACAGSTRVMLRRYG